MDQLISLISISGFKSLKWNESKRKVLELLKKKPATLREIEKELELSSSYRDILVLLLSILEMEKLIESKPLIIPIGGGLIKTKIFQIKEEK